MNFNFDNRFVRELPADAESGSRVRQVHRACYSRVQPTPVRAPQLLAWSAETAALLDLGADDVLSAEFTAVFAGNKLAPGMDPYAACYGGHQFGNWAGQLGDGRAITLGEHVNRHGERWELQLKGAGPTPYSRGADGRAVLRSSIREFVCSEAMHHLGVPTTRALSLIATGEQVMRDMFYDGRARPEPGAVVCRVAPSFIRFGNFELPAARGDNKLLKQLIDFTIARDFPHLLEQTADPLQRHLDWFAEVCTSTALLIAHWMRVGFVHGVLNTDNMSILGLTIDYGPYGWIDNFDLDWTPNTTDATQRRYRFGQQMPIAHWNLWQLANAVYPAIEDAAALEAILDDFPRLYHQHNTEFRRQKLGFEQWREGGDGDETLFNELERILQLGKLDMTLFYRLLADFDQQESALQHFETAFYDESARDYIAPELQSWLGQYLGRVATEAVPAALRRERMNAVNPLYVPRNYLAQRAIEQAEQGEPAAISALLDVLRQPYRAQAGGEAYAARRPAWAEHLPGCSMLSCSS